MRSNNFSILYVEDDLILQKQYLSFLQLYFKNVYKASDGEEALEQYTHHNPDIVILDINIPKINGLKVARTIRKENKEVVLIILTAYSDKEKLLDAIELSLCKYLIKPIKTFELEDILQKVIIQLNQKQKQEDILSLSCGFKWDNRKQLLYSKEDEEVRLTKKKLLLLELFCTNKQTIFSNEDILNFIWNNEEDQYNPNKLRIIFSKLKTKLSCNLFDSIYNVGYKLKGNF